MTRVRKVLQMELTFELNTQGMTVDALERIQAAAPQIEALMAGKLMEIVMANFGSDGLDRPISWAPLSTAYAKKVNRSYATLFVSGTLMNAVKLDSANASVSVSKSDCIYALAHQYGFPPRLPARPFFPIEDDGSVTQYTKDQIAEEAVRAIQRILA